MYDYIIVGAGSAGCVLANRLTEDASVSVLLIEAGRTDTKPEFRIPLAVSKLFMSPYDWAYQTEAQSQLNDRQVYWPRGKVLGGSSSINIMVYIRGHKYDYDQWAEQGNPGWNYADVLPYFKKSERQQHGGSEYHGADGPLHVADLRSPNALSRTFVKAGIQVGLPPNDDFNGTMQEGVGLAQVTQRRGIRDSTADAYLRPALNRPNLSVVTGALVQRIIFEDKRAVGVAYKQQEREVQVRASREVLVCAGAVNSPQLLLLSGIGAGDQLQTFDIPVVAHLPGVGENLQDHLLVPVGYACTRPVSLAGAASLSNLLKFRLFRKGLLTSNIGEAGAFYKTRQDLPAPDLEIAFTPAAFRNPKVHGFTVGSILLAPKSRGYIALRSPDPEQYPAIQPNYLDHTEDIDVLIEGVKLARRLAHAQAFDRYRGEEVSPGPQVQSDQEIAAFVRKIATTVYHPVGTCKMGTNTMAVVDSALRVHGVEGLRVVDASIMPTIVHGHTNATAIMIAEKAADLIKKEASFGSTAVKVSPLIHG
jgi:choline dehydrogenase